LPIPPRRYAEPRLSPDGQRLALTNYDDDEIWMYDISRETFTRFTFGGGSGVPTWSPDGKRLTFASMRAGRRAIFSKPADGSGLEELLIGIEEHSAIPQTWSPDGRLLVFSDDNTGPSAISVLQLGGQRQPRRSYRSVRALGFRWSWRVPQTPFVQIEPTFSPDGRWLTYVSNESGRFEVYVRPFPGPGGKRQISTEGGREPVWARNGKELFYRDGSKMMVVDVTTQPRFGATKPRILFEGSYAADTLAWRSYDITADGHRFVMVRPSEEELKATQINIVLNWFEDLKRRVAQK
jgi:Tol biopolymer transport system component